MKQKIDRQENQTELKMIRRQRESDLLVREEEARRREQEVDERISWLKYQEEKQRDNLAADYENRIRKRENKLQERLRRLEEKEAQLVRREEAFEHANINNSEVQEQVRQLNRQEAEMAEREELLQSQLAKLEVTEKERTSLKVCLEKTKQDKLCLEKTKQDARDQDIDGKLAEKQKGDLHSSTLSRSDDVCNAASFGNKFPFPKFTAFSGEESRPKAEASFEEWRYEVNCIVDKGAYSEQVIAQAIRKSLRDQAKRILMPMGTWACVEMMLNRLENVFGNVASGQSLLQEFYSANQKDQESAEAWGLRLEELVQKASDKGLVRAEDKDEMLRNEFWRSLRSERLKNATRVHFHKGLDFESLRKAVREEEKEMTLTRGIQHQVLNSIDARATEQMNERMKVILREVESLRQEMNEMKEKEFEKRGYRQYYGRRNRQNQNQEAERAQQYEDRSLGTARRLRQGTDRGRTPT